MTTFGNRDHSLFQYPFLSDEAVKEYERDGVVCLRGAFSGEWVERARGGAQRHLDDMGGHLARVWPGYSAGGGREFTYMSRGSDDFRRLALESPAPVIAAFLLGATQIRFWFDHLLPKYPVGGEIDEEATLSNKGTNWHNDLPVWPLRGEQVISLWIALTPATTRSSGMEYIRGSHRWGGYRLVERGRIMGRAEHPMLPDIQTLRRNEPERFVSWNLLPGDCVCHHPLTLHGAGPNRSSQMRLAIALRYLGDGVMWAPASDTLGTPIQPQLKIGDPAIDDNLFPPAWP